MTVLHVPKQAFSQFESLDTQCTLVFFLGMYHGHMMLQSLSARELFVAQRTPEQLFSIGMNFHVCLVQEFV